MKRYVSLDALVAEVERRMKLRQHSYEKYKQLSDFITFEELEYFHDEFIPTLEVKEEVDLEKEMSEYFVEHSDEFFSDKYKLFAQHFFELD